MPLKITEVVCISLVVGFLLVSCTTDTKTKERQELLFWQFWEEDVVRPIIREFELENPGIKVRLQQLTWSSGFDKIIIAIASNMAPDVCELGSTWVPRFIHDGVVLDITEEVEDLKEEVLMWEPVTYNGRIYGLPWVVGTRCLFYNRDLFERAGLSPDRPPETWSELLRAAKAIHSLGDEIYGFGMNAGERYVLYKKFMPFAWANGGRILHDGICVFNSPQVLEALRFYKSLSKYSMLEKQDVLDQVFKSGQIGMMVSGAWNLKRIPQDAPELDFGVALMPRPERSKKVPASFGGGEMLVLLRGCRNKEASVRFIRFLAREDNALKLCREVGSVFPATRSAPKNPYYRKRPKEAVFIKQLTYAIHPPTHPLWVEIQEEINLAIEKALFGGDPQEVLRDCSLRIEKIIK